MFKIEPKCSICTKEIKGIELVYFKMRYPLQKGFTEIKAYLLNEAEIICEDCYKK
jgi:hypothetical protein